MCQLSTLVKVVVNNAPILVQQGVRSIGGRMGVNPKSGGCSQDRETRQTKDKETSKMGSDEVSNNFQILFRLDCFGVSFIKQS